MVKHVGERAFRFDLEALGDGEGLAQPGGEVDEAGTNNGANLVVAEAADGQRRRTVGNEGSAGGGCVAGAGRAGVAGGPR